MKQKQIQTITQAANAAELIVGGITEFGATINLAYNPPADITTELTHLMGSCGTLEQGKQIKATRRIALANAVSDAQKVIRQIRDALKAVFGNEYNSLWTALGFQGSIAMVEAPEDVKRVLKMIIAYYTNNPTQEIANYATAARAQAALDAVLAAQLAVTSQDAEIKQLMNVRDQKFDVVCKRISSVYQELRNHLGPLDPRWKKFGFNIPGADATPEVPTGLKATLIGPTAAALKWDATERASYYRVWKKVVGVDADPVAVGSPADLDFTIENLPTGATIEIYVSAVNDGGESALTEKVTVTTHP